MKKNTLHTHLCGLLHRKVRNRPNLQRALGNAGWLFADKIVRMGTGLVIGLLIARYLGPERYGFLCFLIAFTGMFGIVGSLGLNGVVVRDLITHPEETQETLGAAFVLQFAGGLIAYLLAVALIGLIRPGDDLLRMAVALLGFALTFKCSEVIKYWYESQVRSRVTVSIETGAFIVFAGVRFVLVVVQAPLGAFVWALFGESLVVALLLFIVYQRKTQGARHWRVKPGRIIAMLSDSWPLILSGLAVALFMRVDQIMLGHLSGDRSVGVYAAAVRIGEIWYFIPGSIVASVFPAIVASRKTGEEHYYRRLQKLFDYMVLSAITLSVLISVFANLIVSTLFGAAYIEAADVLRVNVWGAVFVFFGVPWTSWMIYEGRQRTILALNLLSLASNVVLNFLLIPRYGPMGAAVATTISLSLGQLVFAPFFPDQRQAVRIFWRSMNPLRRIRDEYRLRR